MVYFGALLLGVNLLLSGVYFLVLCLRCCWDCVCCWVLGALIGCLILV